ncbi:CRISPR-associated endoribonuclease Cas6 [Adhaeribacter arboris]|uniref:CRISPR-associated endoribonuclease n=1 Tax=Adhaeribacter arboris TaxID=2072846 RepID=A0A2T2YHE6_9BACT|nr:CRISPR-associated endoribonuclease Cas6 [Adhaeribacter arboris]PSR54929.1 CRISPR-associated endoribonuclease Cas6 [Adhaeribacter arboris]
MRFKLELRLPAKNNLLPLNYQYELSAWIYKVLNLGDASFSTWLHNQGYLTKGKPYKLFTFSRLQVSQFKIQQDRLQILSGSVSLLLSFYTPVSAETFITGLFRQQQFSLGDAQSRVPFEVSTIQAESGPEFNGKARFRLLSPACVSTSRLQNGRNMPLYLAPDEVNFAPIFIQNLLHKIEAGQLVNSASVTLPALEEVRFTLLSKPVSKLVTIKAGTPQQTKVRGYLFDFALQAPQELLEAGYYAGFGEKNSLGFGCAEVLP